MPAGVRDQRRQDDGADPLGESESEQQLQRGHQQGEHDELAELHANVEREQRRQHVGAGELKGLAKREREAEAVDQAERERDDPAAAQPGATMFSSAM